MPSALPGASPGFRDVPGARCWSKKSRVPIVGKSRKFKLWMISADSAEWELVKLS